MSKTRLAPAAVLPAVAAALLLLLVLSPGAPAEGLHSKLEAKERKLSKVR